LAISAVSFSRSILRTSVPATRSVARAREATRPLAMLRAARAECAIISRPSPSMIRSEIARPSAGRPESRQMTSTALLSSSPPRASCSAIATSALALASPSSSQSPASAFVAQWALPNRIVASAGPFWAFSVSRMDSRIWGSR
jgi:hypothetical protein